MLHIVRKPYWNYEKEEKWLNEMAAKGLGLRKYSWCRYEFEDIPKGEYIYRIIYLKETFNHPESQKYIEFLEETGVEYVSSYMHWVYLRKKAADGPFEVYSDIDSKLTHYRKVNAWWMCMMILELSISLFNIFVYFINGEPGFILNLVCGLLLLLLAVMFFFIGKPIRKNIRKLKKEMDIRES